MIDNFNLTEEGVRPIDISNLSTDRYYREWLLRMNSARSWMNTIYSSLLQKTEKTLQLIKDELSESDSSE